ncbi:endonuclease/exonuclease/phosphatase family protein [Herbiconiux sp. VKM Ac-1786]|nr:endonuclease/exonuclease/phosphatase family protein [Herbiconiux sp. VKM Ac-1786]
MSAAIVYATAVGEWLVSSSGNRIVTLNVMHGGGARVSALIRALEAIEANVLVLSEFRTGRSGDSLAAGLERLGYSCAAPDSRPRENSVLVASRDTIETSSTLHESATDGRHLRTVRTAGLTICGVYMPLGAAKLPYWELVIDAAQASAADLFVGDFNTGTQDLDRDPRGAPFVGADRMQLMTDTGFVDLWRSAHPETREYTWFSRGAKNGFRLDQAFASRAFTARVSACFYDQNPRTSGITDHAALVVEFD